MKDTKVRILVAFGDLSGFTLFLDSITNDEVEYDSFMAEFDAIIERTARETGWKVDVPGDGFMFTIDLRNNGDSKTIVQAVQILWRLLKDIEKLINEKNSPKPSGFRIVAAVGYAKRKKIGKNETVDRSRHINWAHNYLDKARGKGLVVMDSLKQAISDQDAKKYKFKFTPLDYRSWVLKVGR